MKLSSKHEFLAVLLLYASRADMEISAQEKKFIRKEVGQDNYVRARKYMKHTSDFEVLQSVTQYREKFYPGQSGKAELEEEIRNLFDSDGTYTDLERVIFMALRKII